MTKSPRFLSFFIAWRYYKSRNSVQLIQLLSRVSVISVTACISALIIILSVFNGFHGLIESLYRHFYTDLRIEAHNGAYFQLSSNQKQALYSIPQIASFGQAIRSKALLQSNNGQISAKLYGVDSTYLQLIELNSQLSQSQNSLQLKSHSVILGQALANSLGLDKYNNLLNIYVPKRNLISYELEDNLRMGQFQMINQFVTGQADFDNQLVWLPLRTLQSYLGVDSNSISQLSLNLKDSRQTAVVIEALQPYFPEKDFEIASYYAQNRQLYSVINGEKTAITLILSFILLLASFNITGTLSLAILHKRSHILLLFGIGLSQKALKLVFLYLGLLLGIFGTIWGLVIGGLLLLTQYYWHWIPIQNGNFLVDYFPVRFQLSDFLLVMGIGLAIAFLASIYAVYRVGMILSRNNSLRLK